jgi:hypothetical protein
MHGHNPLRVKYFHGLSAGDAHECSLKSRIGEVRLLRQFPKASTIATPFRDPIAETIVEYQAFLKSLGYSPLSKTAFGKKVR